MTVVIEKFGQSYLGEDREILPLADVTAELDSMPPDNASRIQARENLRRSAEYDAQIKEQERGARIALLTETALENAGPYETLEEHRKTHGMLVEVAADISMYRGGEKGGFKTKDFQDRYKQYALDVESGAIKNHRDLVNKVIPKLYKAAELKEAGFSEYDVNDDVNQMRHQLMQEYGGPENKKKRADARKRLK